MIKIGLIGAGFMGGMHSACYGALKDMGAVITAVADLDEDKAKEKTAAFGAEYYSTGMELIEKADVDIIDICLPTYMHTEHAIAAMKRGRAVFIEKPVCLTSDEAEKLLEVQKETGAKVMVGQCIRMWAEYDYLKGIAESGKYGKLLSGVFHRISPRATWSWNNWLNTPECSGSIAFDMHIHDADYVRYLMGEPQDLSTCVRRDSEGVIQHIITEYKYDDALVVAEGSWDYPQDFPFSMAYRVKFEKATLVFDSTYNPSLTVYLEGGGVLTPEMEKDYEGENSIGGNISSLGAYYTELKYFVGCISEGKDIEKATLADSVKSVDLILRELDAAGGAKLQ